MSNSESVQHFVVTEAGNIPNNETLPVILYKGVVDFGGKEPEGVFEEMFARNDWGQRLACGEYLPLPSLPF